MSLQTPYTNEQMLRLLSLAHRHSNPNLLDNWYFADPINQRGETEYTNSASRSNYSIDRWILHWYPAKLSVDGGVAFSNIGQSNSILRQYIVSSEDYAANFGSKTVTTSLLANNMLLTATVTLPADFKNNTYYGYAYIPGKSTNIRIAMHNHWLAFDIYIDNKDGDVSLNLIAAKLELGEHQTLAHQDDTGAWVLNDPPPNKQQELAKCQRYFRSMRGISTQDYANFAIGVASSTTSAFVFVNLPVPMRAAPTVTSSGLFRLSVNGGASFPAVTDISDGSQSTDTMIRLKVNVATGLTQGDLVVLQANADTTADIFLSCEL